MEYSSKKFNDKFYISLLFIFSVLIVVPFLLVHQIGVHADWSFHSARVQQIYLNLKGGKLFTFIGTDTFSKVGNANFLFYPTVFLYPWALLKFIFKPVEAFLIYSWLLIFVTMLVSYFCMLTYRHNKLTAFFFAIIYTIVPYHFFLIFGSYVLGEAQAYTFIPLVLLGMYRVLTNQGWKTLGIGITLEMYCHLVSTFISIEICGILFLTWLCFSSSLNWQVLINICKAIGLFLLLAAWLLIPLITDYFNKSLTKPLSGFFSTRNLGDYIIGCLNNLPSETGGLGLLLVVALLFGWKWCRKGTNDIYVYVVGVLTTLMITSTFPWQWLKRTPLAVIQFPYRYTSFAACFLAIIGAIGITQLIIYVPRKRMTGLLIILTLFSLCLGENYTLVARNHNSNGSVEVLRSGRRGRFKTLNNPSDTPLIINNKNYNDQFSYGALWGETDYFPQRSRRGNTVLNILERQAYMDNRQIKFSQYSKPNRIIYILNATKAGVIDLPTLVYSHSLVKVNNHQQKVKVSSRGTLLVHIDKGKNMVSFTYKPVRIYYLLMIVAGITWIWLVDSFIRHRL